ncbi:MAG: hypothetical protein CGU28_07835 [Candidatus Dactylopiibacterium carminicum]|uniref:Copper chaperone PCu(A)C n=1 Tax=Candidatus Dactylopiibacterium carminicum TaxID=857335 RepID=A0A272ESE7_9RHOO|nr:copper chaperone PCu(A)C [Candidatus Dactylopiibacterium carminicum]KAF7599027.1 copper chaperone PCu(A)C [Candidatus Dactylopiibacterium carminicum]PAS93032.1 MAG: hypothetical protein CGU29_09235 [Candidatus Dactylopiibacterium carminicum]PAS96706.1 MAG: hypothetical protein CGU28_07835 [Candidatus Dactylopiibacterium carminicum]PAS99041.1 MAG: hypothetical protein BSR46_10185 [Candidatus Dactylopiibacterium carminicum]
MKPRFWVAALLCLASIGAHAHGYTAGKIRIDHPWARATAPGAPTGAGFMKIDNGGSADCLLSASAEVAEAVELHTMKMDGNVMRMDKLENGVPLPAGSNTELKPGGMHIMFIGLRQAFKEGDRFPLKLKFEKAGEVTVEIKVEGMGAMPQMHEHAGH